jgi:uncharacterized glyoxalase superfamily protein PhnB
MKIQRLLTNLCSQELQASAQFYCALFDFKVQYESDWFMHLVAQESGVELGIILQQHEVVPQQVQGKHTGMYLTFVVADVEQLHCQAKTLGVPVIQSPQPTFYGQNRMLLMAPEGTVCDISSLSKG